MLTDTHCHLDHNKFDLDRADLLLRAQQAGVECILIPGTSLASSLSAVKLAASHPMLFAAIGVHPTEAATFQPDTLARLRQLASGPSGTDVTSTPSRVVAIGEIGLDYYWDTSPHGLQQRLLQDQLGLAAELHLPVILHFREKGDLPDGPCASDLMEMLESWANRLVQENNPLAERPGVLHSFSGSQATARRAIGLGFYLGVTGPVTYRKDRQELVACLPLERLLIETDAPFMSPFPHRGKRNEPAYVSLIADKIASVHSSTTRQVAHATSRNAQRLFDWVK